jgi:glycosyltransferase involved in cell wall biosynthesis
MLINFISNLPANLRTGGGSARNAAAFSVLKTFEVVHFVGPIDPPVILFQKALSKLLRSAGARGNFSFFSQRRLEAVASEVRLKCRSDADLDFFNGFTPWILTRPERHYVAWNDCTFHDYIDIFHRRDTFRRDDIERIEQAEASWLKKAVRVIFRSDWFAERAISHYGLEKARVCSVGSFGEIDAPSQDTYAGSKEFVFASTNFQAKGGPIVLSAFREVRKHDPSVSLVVVGDWPSDSVRQPGLEVMGILRKEIPEEVGCLVQILARARALVHPTLSDTNPAIIVEAGYFGCPAISSRRFAIPELVEDHNTGILLDNPSEANAVADAMVWILENEDEYQQMRKAAWAKAHGQYSRRQFSERLLTCLREVASELKCH